MIHGTMLLRIRRLLIACTLLVSGCAPEPQGPMAAGDTAAAADSDVLLIHNGTVLTLDESDTAIESGAVAIEKDRIVAVGAAAELARDYPAARRLSAEGGLILPGLVNAHTHAPMVLFRGLADDLELMDWLEGTIFPAEARDVDEEFVRWGTRMACLEMLRGGTTTFADMYYFEDVVAEVADECGMRAVVGETLIDFPAPDNESWDEALTYTRAFIERWREHPRIVPAVAPHSAYTVSGDHLVEAHALASELAAPLFTHLAEARTEIEQVLAETGQTSIHYLESLGVLDQRVVGAHVVWPSSSEIELLARRGVGVAHCPQSNMKVAVGIAPVPAMLAAGIAVGLGTDGAASNNDLNLWEEIDTAAKLHKVASADPTVLPARQALRMATVEGARALGLAAEIGSLEVGKKADLIVVRTDGYHQQPHYDPYSLLTYSTKASDVETVVIDGRLVVEKGRVLTLDADSVLARVATYRHRLQRR